MCEPRHRDPNQKLNNNLYKFSDSAVANSTPSVLREVESLFNTIENYSGPPVGIPAFLVVGGLVGCVLTLYCCRKRLSSSRTTPSRLDIVNIASKPLEDVDTKAPLTGTDDDLDTSFNEKDQIDDATEPDATPQPAGTTKSPIQTTVESRTNNSSPEAQATGDYIYTPTPPPTQSG